MQKLKHFLINPPHAPSETIGPHALKKLRPNSQPVRQNINFYHGCEYAPSFKTVRVLTIHDPDRRKIRYIQREIVHNSNLEIEVLKK